MVFHLQLEQTGMLYLEILLRPQAVVLLVSLVVELLLGRPLVVLLYPEQLENLHFQS